MSLWSDLTVEHKGTKLAVSSSGEGEPTLLLLHGGGDNLAAWNSVAPLLAANFRIIAYDAAGHGQSETPDDVSVEDFLDQIDSVARALKLRRPVLVGHSWGGATALRHAASERDLSSGVVAIDPGLWERGMELPPFDQALIEARGYGWTGTRAELDEKVAAWLMKAEAEAPEEPFDVVEAAFRRSYEATPNGLWHRKPEMRYMLKFGPLVRAQSTRLSLGLFDTVECPVSLICAREGIVGAAGRQLDRLAARPNVSVSWLPGGHYVHWTNAEDVAASIRQFAHKLR